MSIPGADSVSAKICSAAWARVASLENAVKTWFLPLKSAKIKFCIISFIPFCVDIRTGLIFACLLCADIRCVTVFLRGAIETRASTIDYFSCFPYKYDCFRRFFSATGNPTLHTPLRGHAQPFTRRRVISHSWKGLSQGFGQQVRNANESQRRIKSAISRWIASFWLRVTTSPARGGVRTSDPD